MTAGEVTTFTALLRDWARNRQDRVALEVPGDADAGPERDERLTFGAWDRRANAAAHGLLARGVRPGDRVALWFGGLDWTGYAVAYHAVQRAGATAVHAEGDMPAAELARRFGRCGVVGVVCGRDLVPPGGVPGPRWWCPLADLDTGDGAPTGVETGPDDVCDVLYTCGTSGPATALRVTNANLMALRSRPNVTDDVPGDDRLLAPMPLGTTTSQGVIGMALLTPAVVVLTPPTDAVAAARLIERRRIGSVMVTPVMAIRMLAARVGERHDLSCVHTLATSSAPFPRPVAERLLAAVPNAKLVMAYASVQGVPAVFHHVYDPDRPMSLGRPGRGTEVRILGADDREVAPGGTGALWVRAAGPRRVCLDPADDKSFFADGWSRTGDLGRLEPDGEYTLVDRVGDVIRRDGELVSTIELESVLYEHPDVREAAVVGAQDAGGRERVVAVVALTGAGDLAAVRAFAADRLPADRLPARLLSVPALPRNSLGKVLKRELRRAVAYGGSAAGADGELEVGWPSDGRCPAAGLRPEDHVRRVPA